MKTTPPRLLRRLVLWGVVALLIGLALLIGVWWNLCVGLESEFDRYQRDPCLTHSQASKLISRLEAEGLDHGWKRAMLWAALSQSERFIPGDSRSVHRGAFLTLLATGPQPGEEQVILDMTRSGRIGTAFGAHLLAALWVERTDGLDRAFRLLEGGAMDRTIALFALPLVSGRNLNLYCGELLNRSWQKIDPELPSARPYPGTDDKALAEWRLWRATHEHTQPLQAHQEALGQALLAYQERPAPHELDGLVWNRLDPWSHLAAVLDACRPSFFVDIDTEAQALSSEGTGTLPYAEAVWAITIREARAQAESGLSTLDGTRLMQGVQGLPLAPLAPLEPL